MERRAPAVENQTAVLEGRPARLTKRELAGDPPEARRDNGDRGRLRHCLPPVWTDGALLVQAAPVCGMTGGEYGRPRRLVNHLSDDGYGVDRRASAASGRALRDVAAARTGAAGSRRLPPR